MDSKSNLSRMTIDISKESHKRIKAMAAVLGKSMREIIVELIDDHLYGTNKKASQAIKDLEQGKDLIKAENTEDLFKKLGI